jgi:hypothetical protein
MVDRASSRKSDDELVAMLDKRYLWIIKDRRKTLLASRSCLRDALQEAASMGRFSRQLLTINGGPDNAVMLYPEQINSVNRRAGISPPEDDDN